MCAQYCISFADVEKAHINIQDSIHLTPVLTSSILNQIAGRNLFFKCELFQKTGSFKVKISFIIYVFQIDWLYYSVHYR
jgi:serine racemase